MKEPGKNIDKVYIKNEVKEALLNKDVLRSSVFYLILTSLSLILGIFIGGIYLYPAAILASAFFAVAVIKGYQPFVMLFTAAAFIGVLIFTNEVWFAFFIVFMFFPGGIGTATSVRQKKMFNSSVARTILIYIFSSILLLLFLVIETTDPISFKTFFDSLIYSFKDSIRLIYTTLEAQLATTFSLVEIEEFIVLIYTRSIYILPSVIGIIFMSMSAFIYWIVKYCLISNTKTSSPKQYLFMGKFMYVRISIYGAIIYILSSILSIFSYSGQDSMFFYNVTTILNYAFCYAGIGLIDYVLSVRYGLSTVLRFMAGLALVVACIIPFGFSSLISIVAIADSFYHLRRFIKPKRRGAEYLWVVKQKK